MYNTGPQKYDARGWRCDGVIREDVRRACGYPRRQAVKYSRDELKDMVKQLRDGFNIEDIAAYHERTINGVSIALERNNLLLYVTNAL